MPTWIWGARLYPDHDWTESDVLSDIETAEEMDYPHSRMSREELDQGGFERAYERYCRLPEVRALDQVTALRAFLDKYPHWKVPMPTTTGGSRG